VPPLRDLVDKACREVGRDPAEVERTVAVQVRLPGGQGRIQGATAKDAYPPLEGTPGEMAEVLRAYAREGIGHVQLVMDPIDRASIEAFAPVLARLEA
jgi:alkanesulfonate monooxygenase SsuD/methylene tetrahydromethanopterin reductase-like flavin-dependent oxidoreductase (luciferase family)